MRATDLAPAIQRQLAARGLLAVRRPKRDTSAERAFAFQCLVAKLPHVVQFWRLPMSDGSVTPKTRKPREWVYDFVFPEERVIVEIDGGIWVQGAHSHPTDILRNMAKRNDAALAGYVVLAFTPAQVRAGEALAFTQRMLRTRGWT